MAYTDRFPIVNNFLETRLSADCDEGATTLYLENVEALPRILVGRDYIPLVLRDAGTVREIVYVESADKDSGTVAVLRGQENTIPSAWSTGTYAYCTVTADSFQRMRVNGFAPLAADEGRPSITRTSATTVNITGDFTAQIEVGMAVRILSGEAVVEPTDAEIGAIHITSVSFSAGVTSVSFQNVSLPIKVDGIDLGLSVAAAPMYHPDAIVADEDTLTQTQNVLRVSDKFKKELSDRDAAQDAAISAAQSSADAAQSSADAAQSSADAAQSSANAAQSSIAEEKQLLEAKIQQAMPAGTVIAFAANSIPDGFLLCNGAAVSRTTYAALFEAIGTTYGTGNGSTTFNLPNLTDRFIQGSGTAGTAKAAGLPNITGGYTDARAYPYADVTGAFKGTYTITFGGSYSSNGTGGHIVFDASNSNAIYGSAETVQPPAVTMRYYIKY